VGGVCLSFSNAHYGHPRNMILTTPCPNIGNGWETARKLDRPQVITGNRYFFCCSTKTSFAVSAAISFPISTSLIYFNAREIK